MCQSGIFGDGIFCSPLGTENEMVAWHHWLNGHEFEQIPGDCEGQGSLVCWGPWVAKSQTRLSDWTTTIGTTVGSWNYLLKKKIIFGCAGSLLLWVGLLYLQRAGTTLQLWCAGFSLQWPFLLQTSGSVVTVQGLSCPTASGTFPDQGSNLCSLHWQAES